MALSLAGPVSSVLAFDDIHSGPGPAAGGTAAGLPCPSAFVIDFAGLPAGTVLGEQYSGAGVHISAVGNGGGANAAIVFDSNAAPTHDPDLAVNVGNIAVLAKNLNDGDGDGLVDDPDENDHGGKQVYSFDSPVRIGSFVFIDKDHGTPDAAIAYDVSNNVVKEVEIPLAGDGSVQTIVVDADPVSRLEIVYRDSAAVTGIEVGCSTPPTPSPSPSASPTPSPTPSTTPPPTPTASSVVTQPATETPTPSPTVTASPTPLTILSTPSPTPSPSGVLGAVSLPAAGGGFGLTEEPIWFGLAVVTLALLLVEMAILRSGRRR